MFVVSTLELLLIAAYSFIVPNYFVFLFSFSPLWANKEEAVDPPSNGRWRQGIYSWHTFTFYDNIAYLQQAQHFLIIASWHLSSLPPFLDFSQFVWCRDLTFFVWFCSAMSEKLVIAKYSKIYLAPEITWYWLAWSIQQVYHHSWC